MNTTKTEIEAFEALASRVMRRRVFRPVLQSEFIRVHNMDTFDTEDDREVFYRHSCVQIRAFFRALKKHLRNPAYCPTLAKGWKK